MIIATNAALLGPRKNIVSWTCSTHVKDEENLRNLVGAYLGKSVVNRKIILKQILRKYNERDRLDSTSLG